MYKSNFLAIPKKPGAVGCSLFRTISLMSQIKPILKAILNRIKQKLVPDLAEEQYGFVQGKGTRNAIFIMLMLTERAAEVQKEVGYCIYGVLRKLKHIFPNTYQRIKSIRSPAKVGLVVIDLITSPVVSWRGWETPPPPQHRGSAVILCMTSSEGQRGGRRAIIFILW